MSKDTTLENIVNRTPVSHLLTEIPDILRKYIKEGETSLVTYLQKKKDSDGKHCYGWLYTRFINKTEFDDIFEWLASIIPDYKELVKKASKINQDRKQPDNVQHSIDEIPGILKDYIMHRSHLSLSYFIVNKKRRYSFLSYLIRYKNIEGKRSYEWLAMRFNYQEEVSDVFDWLEKILKDTKIYDIAIPLIQNARSIDMRVKIMRLSNPQAKRLLVGTVLAHRGNYTTAAKELGYSEHSSLSKIMETLYKRYPKLAEVVYLAAVGHTNLRGRLQEIHYRRLDEGLAKVENGTLTRDELAAQLGYKSQAGLGMLIKSRERKMMKEK